MSSNWPEVRKIVSAALDQSPEQRRAYVERSCGNDATLREAVWSLLSDDSIPEGFLQPPIEGVAVHLAAGSAERGATIEHVGRYRVTEFIDSGGIGTVYRAVPRDAENAPPVAIKVLKRGMTGEDIQRRFRQEREVLAQLKHRNIARFIDGGVTSGELPYLVMEFVEGRPIDRFCDEQKLPISDRLELFEEVCSAVQYSHRNLVVHRDLKPRNILVTDDGVPKLLDFGIAKLLEDGSSAPAPDPTVTANRMITPQYASPEQVRGAPISTATDVYSLGVVLYELLTGHRPYDLRGKARGEILELIGDVEPTSPSTQVMQTEEVAYVGGSTTTLTPALVSVARGTDPQGLRRELTGDLDTIVLTAMHKDPERRYASVERLAEDLRRYRTGLPILARADTFSYRARKFIRRNKAATIAATIAFISLIAGTTGLAIGLTRAQTAQAQLAEEAKHARLETRKARQVSDLMQSMILEIDPLKGDKDITVREMLEEAAPRFDSELADAPEVLAALHRTLGESYRSLGRMGDAELHLRRALELWDENNSASGDVAGCRSALGLLLVETGDLIQAESELELAHELYRKLFGDNSCQVGTTLHNLAILRREQGKSAEAETLFEQALQVKERLLNSDDSELLETKASLGVILIDRGQYAKAEELLEAVVLLRRQQWGDEDLRLAMTLSQLAVAQRQLRKYEEAEESLRIALAIQQEAYDGHHPDLAHTMNNLGQVLKSKGDLVAAQDIFEDLLERNRSYYGPRHNVVGTTLLNLAGILKTKKELIQAESLYKEALGVLEESVGENHPYVLACRNNLAHLYKKMGRYDEAEPLFHEVLQALRALHGSDHPNIAAALTSLGLVLVGKGDFEAAEPIFRDAVAVARRTQSGDPGRVAFTEDLHGECLTRLGRYEEAEPLLLGAYPVLKVSKGDDHLRTVEAIHRLVDLYDKWDKPEQAEEYRALLEEATRGDESEPEEEEPPAPAEQSGQG